MERRSLHLAAFERLMLMFKRCPNCGGFLKKDGSCTKCGLMPGRRLLKWKNRKKTLTEIRTADIVAAEIVQMVDQTRKLVLNNSIEIGKRLCEAKEMIEHGEWSAWLKNKVKFSQSTAQNLMRIYKEYGAAQGELWGASANSQTLGKLDYSKAVALLAVPADEREQFVEENKVDEMSTRQLQEAIKARDEALEEVNTIKEANEALTTATKEAVEKQQETERNLQALQNNLESAATTESNLNAKIEKLQAELIKADKASGADQVIELKAKIEKAEKQMHDLRTSAKSAKEEVERLKKELAKPVEVATKTVEVVPDAIKKELQELKNKLEKAHAVSSNEALIKAKIYFDTIQSTFNALLKLINTQPQTEQDKLHQAAKKLLEAMQKLI